MSGTALEDCHQIHDGTDPIQRGNDFAFAATLSSAALLLVWKSKAIIVENEPSGS